MVMFWCLWCIKINQFHVDTRDTRSRRFNAGWFLPLPLGPSEDLGVAMAMKPGKKVRKGGPKAAWKKKRAVGKTHRDKAQIQQFQDSYDQVSSICSVQFRSDLVGFILTHVLQNITQHPWTTYNVHWTTLHSNIDWNGKSLKPFLLSYKSRYFLNCFLALQSFAPLLPEYLPIQIFQLHVLCYVNSNWKAWKSMR